MRRRFRKCIDISSGSHKLFIGRESVVPAYLTTSHAILSLLLSAVFTIQVLLCPSYGEEQKLKGEVKRLLDPSRMTPVELRCVVDEREFQPTCLLFPPAVAADGL
jgi:hypothetical protein